MKRALMATLLTMSLASVHWAAAQQAPLPTPEQEAQAMANAPKQEISPRLLRMAEQIRREILTLPDYDVFDNVSYAIKGETVILKGQASRPIVKSDIERIVKKVEGVETVVNEIEVLPLSNFDDRLRARVYAAIYFDPWLSRYNPNRGTPIWITPARLAAGITNDPPTGFHPIHIIVKNGHVTLEGVVDNEGDRDMAGIRANGVTDVFSVDNQLQVTQSARAKKSK